MSNQKSHICLGKTNVGFFCRSSADVYDLRDFDTRKTFITKFIKSIHVYKDYRLEVEFNVSFDEFRNYTDKGEADFSEE